MTPNPISPKPLKPLKPLIFDCSLVPWPKRYGLRAINAAGWSLWLLLWMPVSSSAQKLLAGGAPLDAALAGLFSAISFGALAVLTMAALFAGWTFNQRRGALALRRRLQRARRFLKTEVLAKVFAINHQSLSQWQDSQIMLAHHSDDTGWLQHIDALPTVMSRSLDASAPLIIWKPL